MARPRHETLPGPQHTVVPRPPLNVGGYRGANFITVDTTLPTNPLLVDRSRLPNGYTAADYNRLFARLPRELDSVLRTRGHAEVTITIDERGRVVPVESRSREAPHATYISAMIRRRPDGTNELVGIWSGRTGGGNNGAPASMTTMKLMETPQGRLALQCNPILDAATFDWGRSQLAATGSLNRNPLGWVFSDNGQTTYIPYSQNQTHGAHRQTALGEHHSRHDTWGCLSGTEESFRTRLNARIAIMMGHNPPQPHAWSNGLGLQNTARVAAEVFVRNRDLAANTLGRIYHLNPLMFNTGNANHQALAQQFHIPTSTTIGVNAPLPGHRQELPTAPTAASRWQIGTVQPRSQA